MLKPEKTQNIPFITIFIVEGLSILFYGIFTEYSPEGNILADSSLKKDFIYTVYDLFQDIHVMMFIGFGFLMTFLKKFWFSSLGMNFWLAALSLQWSILIDGFFERLLKNESEAWNTKIQIDIKSLVNGDFAAASILICFGAVLGKVTLNQATLLAFLQLIFYSLNQFIAVVHLKIVDIGGSMIIHTFGAYFGLAASRVITNKKILISSADVQGSNYTSDLFSMVGTLFLWMYWPSFNGALADEDARERVVIHTVLSLTHSCLFSFIISRLVSSDEKFDMIHIQNASLAGGVAIGAVANLNINPFSSMIIGGVAGTISVLGYKYLQPFLEKRFGLHDTCGVHNLHGMPGIIGAIASAIAAGVSSTEDYGQRLYELFPEIEHGRSPIDQGGYQMLCLAITLAIALFSGTISGVLVRYLTVGPKGYFQDQHYWEGAEGYIPIKKVIDNTEEKYKFEEKVLKEDAVTRHHKPTMMFQPEQFLSLQKMESKKTNNKYRKKEEENRKNIATLEKYITNIAESDEKVSIRKDEIVETNSPTKEQKAFSPSKYNRINEKE